MACPEHDVKLFACFQPSNLTVTSLMIVGEVLARRVEQGIVKSSEVTFFLPRVQSVHRSFVTMRGACVVSYERVVAPGARRAGRNAVVNDMAEIRVLRFPTFWPRSSAKVRFGRDQELNRGYSGLEIGSPALQALTGAFRAMMLVVAGGRLT